MNQDEFIQDDFIFKPYSLGGFISIILLPVGKMTIRCKSAGLFTNKTHPYEVRYPNGDVFGYQTGEDIWNYIKSVKTIKKTLENYLELEVK